VKRKALPPEASEDGGRSDGMERDSLLEKLASLDSRHLAEVLLSLTESSEEVDRAVSRLTASPKENIRRFKAGLAALKRRRRFIPIYESGRFADKLCSLLDDLDASAVEPRVGVELVASFYRSDAAVFEACDDSNGSVGDVFRSDAQERFVRYAAACEEKDWIIEVVIDLMGEDPYGVRDAVVEAASLYLPEGALRILADRLWSAGESEDREVDPRFRRERIGGRWFGLVEMVARQLNDPHLFERARRTRWPDLGTAACFDIATVWFAAGDPKMALSWLGRIDPGESFLADKRDDLLISIFRKLDRRGELETLLRRRFAAYRSHERLRELLEVIGVEQGEEMIDEAAEAILHSANFSSSDACFLLKCSRAEEAAKYILDRRARLDGDMWYDLHPLAESMEAAAQPLAATVVYRALLDSVLKRAYTRAYGHGVRQLQRLDHLAEEIVNWGEVLPHREYFAGLREHHGRKSSFWGRYDG